MTFSIDWGAAGLRSVVAEMVSGVCAALMRFPVPTLFLLAAAIEVNLFVARVHVVVPVERGEELAGGLFCGALAALAVALFGEAHGYGRAARDLGGLLAGLVASLLMAFPDVSGTFPWTLVPGLAGLVLVAPFLGRGDGASFWMFCARAALAGVLGLLVLVFLAGGLSAILASLSYLFGLGVSDELYQHVWSSLALLVAPLFALGQLTHSFDERPGEGTEGVMDQGMRVFGDFVAAPLLLLYGAILHVYIVTILITGAVPEGQIGWLVLTYGLCVFTALILVSPFVDRARAPTRAFLKLWPFLLPAPIALLFHALALRVAEYGLTPERALLGLFGAVTVGVVLLQLVPRLRGDVRIIAALSIAAVLAGSAGPQGAVALSINNQAERFLAIVADRPVEGSRRRKALGALRFLAGRDELARVAPEASVPAKGWNYSAVAKAWGLHPGLHFMENDRIAFTERGPVAIPFGSYDTLVPKLYLYVEEGAQRIRLPSGRELAFRLTEHTLVVGTGDFRTTFRLADRLGRLPDLKPGEPLKVALESEGRSILLLLTFLDARRADVPSLERIGGAVLLRESDWR